jgi:hypothetical protein
VSKVKRSKFAAEIRFRIWDQVNSCWVATGSQRKDIFIQRGAAEKAIEVLVAKGRNPSSLSIEKVLVTLAPGES